MAIITSTPLPVASRGNTAVEFAAPQDISIQKDPPVDRSQRRYLAPQFRITLNVKVWEKNFEGLRRTEQHSCKEILLRIHFSPPFRQIVGRQKNVVDVNNHARF